MAASLFTSSSLSLDSPSGFIPRTYPPPCLEDVPRIFQLESLRRFAGQLSNFNDPEQSNCIVVIPFEGHATRIAQDPYVVVQNRSPPNPDDHNGEKGDHPALAFTSCNGLLGLMHLHIDYLSPFSALFRSLFAGMTPRDFITRVIQARKPVYDASGRNVARAPADITAFEGCVPQLMAGADPEQAVVFLPLPDPSSFHYIAYWIYFGKTDLIVRALCSGTITLVGLARNGVFLGMSEEYFAMLRELRGHWALRHANRPGGWLDDTDDESDCDDYRHGTQPDMREMKLDPRSLKDELGTQADDESDDSHGAKHSLYHSVQH